MSEYGAITPTTNGLTMITESVVKKKPIVFTKIAIGDGALTNQNIEALTALIRQKQEAPIHIVTDKGAGLADVSAVITNAGLSTGYYARELGVFAKVGDTGQEKLFAYTNAGANASYSPADGSLDEKLITVTFKIGTGATLKVALNSQVYLTLGNLEEHNTSSSAHADIRTKITNDINTHNTSSSAHVDIRTKITNDINTHNSSSSAHSDIRRMFNSYLPLTGGRISGRTYIDSMLSVGQSSAIASNIRVDGAAGNAYIALLNYNNTGNLLIDGYFNNPETAVIDVTNRNAQGTIRDRSTLMDGNGNAKFANEVYANEKLLATKEYVDSKKWGSTTIADGAVTPTKLDRAYLPLTGGTLTGSLSIDGGNNIVHYIGTAGGNLNLGDATKTKSTALCCINRPIWWNNTLARNLALEEDLNTHNASSSAHADIRELFKWKKLYSVNRAAFVMPASGTALCDIPSTWKELHITWIWTKQTYTINNVVGYYSYTANIINEAIADPIIFVFPGSEGYLVVKNNKLYVIHRGDTDDGAPVLIMWR